MFISMVRLLAIGMAIALPGIVSLQIDEVYQQPWYFYLGIALALVFFFYVIAQMIAFLSAKTAVVIFAFFIFSMFLLSVTEAFVIHFYGGRVDNSLFVHLNMESIRIGLIDFPFMSIGFIVLLIVALVGVALFTHKLFERSDRNKSIAIGYTLLAVALFTIGSAARSGIQAHPVLYTWDQLYSYYFPNRGLMPDAEIVDAYGLSKPSSSDQGELVLPKHRKNLILIYLESINYSFTGPGGHLVGLTPNLDAIAKNSIVFDNYYSSETFTIAGIIASMCGMSPPMALGNDSLAGVGYYSNLMCLPDILSRAGYHQEFFGGANKIFAGKSDFLQAHSFDNVYGVFDYPVDRSKHPSWGLYDSKLFELAFERIAELKQSNQPFHITMLTLNTHIPGVRSPDCTEYTQGPVKNSMLNAVHCTDQSLGRFIRQLDEKGYLDDTIVAITSDHILFRTEAMKKAFGAELIDDHRINFIVKLPEKNVGEVVGTLSATYDFTPTLLDYMGIGHEYKFTLGKSILRKSADASEVHDRYGLFKRNSCFRDVSGDQVLSRNDACYDRALLKVQDRMINNLGIASEEALCDRISELDIYASRIEESVSHAIIKRIRPNREVDVQDVLDEVSLSGWMVNRKKSNGFFYIVLNTFTSRIVSGFVQENEYHTYKKFKDELSKLTADHRLIIVSNGNHIKLPNDNDPIIKTISRKNGEFRETRSPYILVANMGSFDRRVEYFSEEENTLAYKVDSNNCRSILE